MNHVLIQPGSPASFFPKALSIHSTPVGWYVLGCSRPCRTVEWWDWKHITHAEQTGIRFVVRGRTDSRDSKRWLDGFFPMWSPGPKE